MDGGLDLASTECALLVDAGKVTSLLDDSLEDIINEGVHDVHGSLGDTTLRVDLSEDLVDVDIVGLGSGGSLLLLAFSIDLLLGDGDLLNGLSSGGGGSVFSHC